MEAALIETKKKENWLGRIPDAEWNACFWKEEKRYKAGDIVAFAKRYLPHYATSEFADFHLKICKTLQGQEFNKREVWIAPRGHAKSTLISIIYPLWCICTERKKVIVLISSKAGIAKNFLASIKKELETNVPMSIDFGELEGKEKWTDTDILTANGISVIATGADADIRGIQKYGVRPDLIICDDLENRESVNTFEQREKMQMLFDKDIQGLVGRDADILVIGTVLHGDSLLARLLKNWKGKKYQAIQEDGTALWPDRFPAEKLKLIKGGDGEKAGIGSLAFEQEYQNNPIDPETQIVRSNWIQYFNIEDIGHEELLIASALDPSIGAKNTSDYSAIVTVGRSNGNYYVLDCDMERRTPQAQIEAVGNCYDRWGQNANKRWLFTSFGIEANAFQIMIKDEIDRLEESIPTREIKNVSDKVARIQSISPLIEQGRVRFRRGMTGIERLVEQLTSFPKGAHDDGPDALEMAVRLLSQGQSFCKTVVSGKREFS